MTVGLYLVLPGRPAVGATLETGDGLSVTFSDASGAVTAIGVSGNPVPLIAGQSGGLSVRAGRRIPPGPLSHFNFDSGIGPLTSARNAYWDHYGSYLTWIPDGGAANGPHLLLGDGTTEGAGMAMESPISVSPGSRLRISWQARSASVETTHILCVRIYNATGQDITSTANRPSGWNYSSTSLAHGVWGFGCGQPNTWQYFERFYDVPADAAFVRVSLRHWTGGDHLLHIDDFNLDVVGGIEWSARTPILGPVCPSPGGLSQTADAPGCNLRSEMTVAAGGGRLDVAMTLQDTSAPLSDRPIQLFWTLPVSAEGGQWWDDIGTQRQIGPGTVYRHAFSHNRHLISVYPFSSITGDGFGLSLAVPQREPLAQRFEYDSTTGLSCVWEIGLSPISVKIGPGRAAVSMCVFHHDPAWGFRAAASRYYELFPDYFVKRTTREGAWMYPIHPSQIPDPMDFGFAFHETWPLDQSERDLCAQLGIGIFYYTEPWCPWQPWGDMPEKPPYDDRVALLESWAATSSSLAQWIAEGGIGNSGHLLLGDRETAGAGMATAQPFAVQGGQSVSISWQAKVADTAGTQILCVRLFDSQGTDITQSLPAPPGWFYSSTSLAHVVAGITSTATDLWQPFVYSYAVAGQATQMRLSLRHWNGGDLRTHIDDLRVEDSTGQTTWLAMDFDQDDGTWTSAQNDNWGNGGPTWLRVPRQQAAQAVINSSPLDAAGRYFIDANPYLWHEWAAGIWNQAWPVNSDPDLPEPNTFRLYHDHWVLSRIAETDGAYIDSVTTTTIAGWENRRPEHLAVSDSPLTFSWDDGGAAQIAPQAHAEFLGVVAPEVRSLGKLMMLNIFPNAMRFHAQNGDILGSEVFELVESDASSRVRRTLARHRVVTNLLQWGWDSPTYATYDEMERFIRGQLFWGFYPAVSSAGGPLSGGTPDRYFLHPELYERDRPLFKLYIPVIRALSTAGWEPITRATATDGGQVERFGDFARGDVYLTVRGAGQAALEAQVSLDLAGAGMPEPCPRVIARDVLADAPIQAARLTGPPRLRFNVSLGAGEVGVYRFARFVAGDCDGDRDVDSADWLHFESCLSGPDTAPDDPACQISDLDCDGDVDQSDFGLFQRCLSGPQVLADWDCDKG